MTRHDATRPDVVAPFVNGRTLSHHQAWASELREPASDAYLAGAVLADESVVNDAVAAARDALHGRWQRTRPSDRSRLLHALADGLHAHREELADLEARNVGKAITTVHGEIAHAEAALRYFAAAVAHIGGRSNLVSRSVLFHSLRCPVGVVGQIVPWNYPLLMAAWKIAPALAAGCTVVLKPDPATPLTAVRLAQLAHEVGVPPGVVNVVPGDGPTVGAALTRHPGIDKIAFTGSTQTGADIVRATAQPIKRLSLELGGKSPTLVFADADLDEAVPGAVWSVFSCAGQSCEARSRILVHERIFDDFLSRFVDTARRLRVGDPLHPDTQIGSLISRAHRERVHGFVERARADGADVTLGGQDPTGSGAFYPPTIVINVAGSAEIAQDEVFGPVAVVIPFRDEEHALRLANDTRYGLMATVWTTDLARAHRLAVGIRAGTVGINHPHTTFPGVPFGGFGDSGFGREFALETLDLYLETKSVLSWIGRGTSNPIPTSSTEVYRR